MLISTDIICTGVCKGPYKVQMVLYTVEFIEKVLRLIVRRMYGLRNEMWYMIIKLYLMNNKLLYYTKSLGQGYGII